MPKKRDRDNGDAYDDMFGGAEDAWSEGSGESSRRHDGKDTGRQDDMTSNRQEEERSDLEVLLETLVDRAPEPRSEKPPLGARSNAYVSESVAEASEQVVMALQRHFGKDVSKSLITDFALRVVLNDLVNRGEESSLVKWLEQTVQD